MSKGIVFDRLNSNSRPSPYKAKRSSLPPSYVPLLFFSLFFSVVSLLNPSVALVDTAVVISAGIGGWILCSDALIMWHKRGIVGRLTFNTAMFFWFWMGALEGAFSSPAFPTPDTLYRGFNETVPASVVAAGTVCANLFALMAMIGWKHLPQPQRLLSRLADRMDPGANEWMDLLALILASLAWVPYLISYQGNLGLAFQDMLLMRSGGYAGASADSGIFQHFYLIGLFGGALALARIIFKAPGVRALRYMAFALALPIVFLSQGSRFNLGFLLMPALLAFTEPTQSKFMWRKRKKQLIVLVCALVMLVAFQGMMRSVGLAGDKPREVPSSGLQGGLVGSDHFGAMLVAIDLADKEGFFFEPMLPFFVTHFIPRAIWPGKPNSKSWDAYNFAWTQGYPFNVTPSITGQYYYNWGFFGVAYIGLFMGWLAQFCELWFARLNMQLQMMSAIVAGLLLAFLFLSFRFFYPLYFAYPLFGYLAYRFISTPKLITVKRVN